MPLSLKEMNRLREKIPHSFSFGNINVFPNVFLSPMSGVTDNVFRQIISKISDHRTGLLVSEFISVEGLTRLIPKTCKQMRFTPEQKPYVIQIFGSDLDRMAGAAKMAEDAGADAVEINCGCPAPKVVRRGGGSGLLKDLDRYTSVLRRVIKAVTVPVSVKVRIGFCNDSINVLETNKIAQEEGAELFIIHGRTRNQGYRGLSNWDIIGEVAAQSKIPVVGNGDILTLEDVVEKMHTYGVSGVSLGRGAMHNPWIFKQVLDFYEGREPKSPSPQEYIEFFRHYRDYLLQDLPHETAALGRLKQIAARIVKGFHGSAIWRKKMLLTPDIPSFIEVAEEYYNSLGKEALRDFSEIGNLNGKEESQIQHGVQYTTR